MSKGHLREFWVCACLWLLVVLKAKSAFFQMGILPKLIRGRSVQAVPCEGHEGFDSGEEIPLASSVLSCIPRKCFTFSKLTLCFRISEKRFQTQHGHEIFQAYEF